MSKLQTLTDRGRWPGLPSARDSEPILSLMRARRFNDTLDLTITSSTTPTYISDFPTSASNLFEVLYQPPTVIKTIGLSHTVRPTFYLHHPHPSARGVDVKKRFRVRATVLEATRQDLDLQSASFGPAQLSIILPQAQPSRASNHAGLILVRTYCPSRAVKSASARVERTLGNRSDCGPNLLLSLTCLFFTSRASYFYICPLHYCSLQGTSNELKHIDGVELTFIVR